MLAPSIVRPAARPVRPAWRLLLPPAGLAALVLLLLVLFADDHGGFDLAVYTGAVTHWSGGGPLYDWVKPGSPYGFTYPPFAALVLLPLAVLPTWLALTGLVVADAAAITGLTWWLAGRVAPLWGVPVWQATAWSVPLVCLLEPVRDTVGFGQVNLLLAALVVADVAALRRGSWWAGVLVGLAAAVKLTPAVFVVLLLAWRPRAALNAVVAGALATTAAFIVAPATSLQFWTSTLFQTERVGALDDRANQALSGVLARLSEDGERPLLPWLALVVVVGAVGLTRAVQAARARDDLAALALTGLTGGLISPITWTHHLWWVLPALPVLVRAGRADRRWLWWAAGSAAVLASSLPDLVQSPAWRHLLPGPLGGAAESSAALVCLALVLVLPVRRAQAPAAITT